MVADSKTAGPDATSSDYDAMIGYWEMVDAIMGGVEELRCVKYLQPFEEEKAGAYEHRRKRAPLTNIFADIVGNLASKPFAKEVKFLKKKEVDGKNVELVVAQKLLKLAEDIDGQGNNLSVFASAVFEEGIAKAIDWIFVDHTKAIPNPDGRPLTRAEEDQQGLRPYWVHIPAGNVIAVYSDHVNGSEVIFHARIKERAIEREGFGERELERVRVLDRQPIVGPGGKVVGYSSATYQLYEKRKVETGKEEWVSIEGPEPLTIGIIPLVPFLVGRRIGSSWRVKPPLRDLAHLQIEEFQQESNLKSVLDVTAFPMLKALGVPKELVEKMPVGPRVVLLAPLNTDGSHGDFGYVEIGGESIKALEEHLDATRKEMRDLGMQPLTRANLTVITTANVSEKAHSAVQRWALALKDALEQAFRYTVMWLNDGSKDPELEIHTDFGIDLDAGVDLDALIKLRASGDLSRPSALREFKRRGVLGDDFDPDQNDQELEDEGPALGTIPPQPGQAPPPANDGSQAAAA